MQNTIREKKSIVVTLLLTIIFGPIGLLYATIIGGIIMTAPFLIFFFYLNDTMLAIGSTIVYLPFAWVISIIWGMIAVSIYNKRVEKAQYQSIIAAINAPAKEKQITTEATEKQMLKWLKENPEKTANDYYFERYGGQ